MAANIRYVVLAGLVLVSVAGLFEQRYLFKHSSDAVKAQCAAHAERSFAPKAYTNCLRRHQ